MNYVVIILLVAVISILGYFLYVEYKSNKLYKRKLDEVYNSINEIEKYAYTDIRLLQDYLKAVDKKMREWGIQYDKTRKN